MSSDSKLLRHRKALMNIVRRIALEAGAVTLDYYDAGGFTGAGEKADGSPVTIADRQAEALIVRQLQETTPGVPVVGEELTEAGQCPDLTGAGHVWYVDALDGTREFIAGGDEYTVNIALVHDGVPVLGVVYLPVKGELYAGCIEEDGNRQAIRWLEETGREKDIRVRAVPREGFTAIVSKSHGDHERLEAYLAQFKIEKLIRRSSSLKFCALASGKADIYPRFGPTSAWDIAAGHALLAAAGGEVRDLSGALLRYRACQPPFIHEGFIASAAQMPDLS